MESEMSENTLLFKDLGYRLKREREQKGFTVDQVIQLTRISRTNITAIEEGNLDELPHTVYAKGFIRGYAEFLGVPLDEVDQVLEQVIDRETETNTYTNAVKTAPTGAPIKGADTIREASKKSSLPTVILILLLVGVLAGLVWFVQGKTDLFTPAEKQKAEEIMEKDALTPPDEELADERFQQEQTDEAVMDRDTPGTYMNETAFEDAAAVSDAASEGNATQGEEQGAQPSSEEASPAAEAPKPTDAAEPAPAVTPVPEAQQDADAYPYKKHSVAVTAKAADSCWMEVRSDGGTIKEFFIQRGQTARFAYNQSLWIRLGNAGGVTMKHNGKAYPLDSRKGQVKTIIFP